MYKHTFFLLQFCKLARTFKSSQVTVVHLKKALLTRRFRDMIKGIIYIAFDALGLFPSLVLLQRVHSKIL